MLYEPPSTAVSVLIFTSTGIFIAIDVIFGILIIVAIILQKKADVRECQREADILAKATAAVAAYEERKRKKENRHKTRMEMTKDNYTKPLKHQNTESEKLSVEYRPQKLYIPEKKEAAAKGGEKNNNERARKEKAMKGVSEPATLSERFVSRKEGRESEERPSVSEVKVAAKRDN